MAALTDPALPALPHLLGPDAGAMLDAALAPLGGHVEAWRASQVQYRPGRSLTVRYATEVVWGDGTRRVETLVAQAREPLPAGIPVLAAGDVAVGIWRFPFDPYLPGLAAACDPEKVRRLLHRLGLPAGNVHLRTRAYRAGRRAVVEVRAAGTPDGAPALLYLKAVKPRAAEALHDRHRSLHDLGVPVPDSYGVAAELGLVALESKAGLTLRDALTAGVPVPDAAQVWSLQRTLSTARMPESEIRNASVDPLGHARMLGTVLPREAARLEQLALRCGPSPTGDDTIHGDFYDTQLLVGDGAVTALLDIDDMRAGNVVEDCAMLLGHLDNLALVRPLAAERLHAYIADLHAAYATVIDPALLGRRTAAAMVGIATSPFRHQADGWQQLTVRAVERAEAWAAGQGVRGPS